MNDIIWKPVRDFEEYKVSNTGLVMGKRIKNHILKCDARGNYRCAILSKKVDDLFIVRPIYVHRLVAIAFIPNPNKLPFVDHIDRNKLNNNVNNLRWCTRSQNALNQVLHRNDSGYRGVSWNCGDKKWASLIRVNGKRIFLGNFHDPKDAAKKYNEAAIRYFGREFIVLNVI